MSKHYKTYNGQDPYIFFSYAHIDSDKILPIIDYLDKQKYRLWYDAGIRAGGNWPETVASHLLNAGYVLFFISDSYFKSQNCRREVNYAVAERKKMCCIFLEDVRLPEDMAMQFSTAETIYAFQIGQEDTCRRIIALTGDKYLGDGVSGYEAVVRTAAGKNIWRILFIVFATLCVLFAVFIYGYFNNWFSSAGMYTTTLNTQEEELELTEFRDDMTRNILLKAYEGSSLYLCGDYMVSSSEAIRFDHGKWFINDIPVEKSDPLNIDILADKTNIEYLSLVSQGIEALSPLKEMGELVYLDVSGNPCGDLSFLAGMQNLQTLKIIGIKADYSVLNRLDNLKYVFVSYDMLDEIMNTVDVSKINIIVKR